jgi:hypothetical protein
MFSIEFGLFCNLLPLKWGYFKKPKLFYIKPMCWAIFPFWHDQSGGIYEKVNGQVWWLIFHSHLTLRIDWGQTRYKLVVRGSELHWV